MPDLAVLAGCLIAFAYLIVFGNLLVDVVRAYLDPRLRVAGDGPTARSAQGSTMYPGGAALAQVAHPPP